MIIPVLKLWILGAMIVTLLLIWQWDWSKTLLGMHKVQIEDESRKWYERPKEEWVEREPTILDAIFFSLAWPLLLISTIGGIVVYLLMNIAEG